MYMKSKQVGTVSLISSLHEIILIENWFLEVIFQIIYDLNKSLGSYSYPQYFILSSYLSYLIKRK